MNTSAPDTGVATAAASADTAASGLPGWATGLWPAPEGVVVSAGTGQAQRRLTFAPMTAADLDAVHAVETSAYAHPWTRRNFLDSLQSGHPSVMLLAEPLPQDRHLPVRHDGRLLLGYLVAMSGVDEVHLLNITVAPAHQRQGWARFMLDALALWSRGQGAQWLWLEVRQSNAAARSLYGRCGFAEVGLRRGYYPLAHQRREDAVVMSLNLVARRATEAP